ncbi:MAG: hypothetical protein P1U39_05435 [Legionellaceae bacterium]|nr:hypothetical protein [Legionellaceae bacterium]
MDCLINAAGTFSCQSSPVAFEHDLFLHADYIIIGSGTSGITAAIKLAQSRKY